MFTGLVQELGILRAITRQGPGARIELLAPLVAADAKLGDSIAVNGCCLTVIEQADQVLAFEVGPETLSRTNLGELRVESRVNLEPSLRVGDRLGGHFVSGHVEGLGRLLKRQDDRDWSTFWFEYPRDLGRYLASKGSIAVDGVSLTLVDVSAGSFSVALIPHTLEMTTLGSLAPGAKVNLETDLLAKYAQKQLDQDAPR